MPEIETLTYRVSFSRLGRGDSACTTDVDVPIAEQSDPDFGWLLGERISSFVRKRLASNFVDVIVDVEACEISVYVGARSVGRGSFVLVRANFPDEDYDGQ